jgi:putative nucleotidyltransferase with HDIG domain
MEKIEFKTDITWRSVALRVALVLGTVAIIVWFMPRDNKFNFKMEVDKVWLYNDLNAQFDFPVYKTDSLVQAERDEVLNDFAPYYVYRNDVAARQEKQLANHLNKNFHGFGRHFQQVMINSLHAVYAMGIVDTKEPLNHSSDSSQMLRRIDDKDVTMVSALQVMTPREAYERILQASELGVYRDILKEIDLNNFLEPNLTYDEDRTESARLDLLNSIPLAVGVVQSGQKIVSQGEVVTEQTYQILASYKKEIDRRYETDSAFNLMVIGEALYVLLLITLFIIYLSLYRKEFFEKMRYVGMLFSLVIIATLMASLLVGHSLLHVYILPFAIVPIFVRVFMDSRTAIVTLLTVVLICASILQKPLEFIAVEMVAGLVAVYSLRELSSRSQLFWTAILTTMVAMFTNLAVFMIRHNDFTQIDDNEYVYLAICGIIIFCSYPMLYLFEKFFGFISDITLIELSDMNKDLLRRMSEVAPGTFQHSIQVGNLAAEIARKIGGNPQLVRTGALYHDIGKMQNSIYFTENQSGGINPHDGLTYIESAQIIISHVTEGLKLADKYGLPVQIRDLIATHHGQGKAKYFYIKYKNEFPDQPVDDLLFTYPGPNPFTKEQAILMMADAVEAASRSLPDYTEQSIRQLVHKLIDTMVEDGFFHECPITFRDIEYAKTVLIEKLKTIYHTRISYPEMNSAGSVN